MHRKNIRKTQNAYQRTVRKIHSIRKILHFTEYGNFKSRKKQGYCKCHWKKWKQEFTAGYKVKHTDSNTRNDEKFTTRQNEFRIEQAQHSCGEITKKRRQLMIELPRQMKSFYQIRQNKNTNHGQKI